ncbi:MAG TPA: hypothetical protein VNM67_23295 [Thermoanaerobaculia bacterium]|jgi:hypothetical protein|nr:hypothetical protein [Thermoanaerobaculia bacterium]
MALTARAYTGPECPRCSGYLDLDRLAAGEHRCTSCGGIFLATPFKPPVLRERVGSVAEAGPEGAVPCARHTGNAAVGNCTRCGVFMCNLCRIEIEGQELCPGCFDRLTAEGVLSGAQTRIRDYRGMAISLGVLGLLLSCFGLITGPLTLFFVAQALRQKRRWNEKGGVPALVIAGLLGAAQIVISIFVVVSLFLPLFGTG